MSSRHRSKRLRHPQKTSLCKRNWGQPSNRGSLALSGLCDASLESTGSWDYEPAQCRTPIMPTATANCSLKEFVERAPSAIAMLDNDMR